MRSNEPAKRREFTPHGSSVVALFTTVKLVKDKNVTLQFTGQHDNVSKMEIGKHVISHFKKYAFASFRHRHKSFEGPVLNCSRRVSIFDFWFFAQQNQMESVRFREKRKKMFGGEKWRMRQERR